MLSGLSITLSVGGRQVHRGRGSAGPKPTSRRTGIPSSTCSRTPTPKKHGWAVAPRQGEAHQAVFHLAEPATLQPGTKLIVRLDHQFEFSYPGFQPGPVPDLRDRRRHTRAEPELARGHRDDPVGSRRQADPEQTATLLNHYNATAPETKATRDEIARLKKEIDAILASVRTPITRELPETGRRITRIHRRGNFLDQGDPVQPSTPGFFPPLPKDAPRNRLGVARWLARPRESADGAGRGQPALGSALRPGPGRDPGRLRRPGPAAQPSRAARLAGLRVPRRRLVAESPLPPDRDLGNLPPIVPRPRRAVSEGSVQPPAGRGPRFRLEAEMIRDSALLVSGLLSSKMHGRSVMPHQPEGIWRSTYNTDKWILSPGEDRYRRGLYTFLKRTSPYPALMTFDAPSREVCTVRRITTNTPLQALVTLNDPAYIEAAQALARRMVREAGATAERPDPPRLDAWP